MSTTRKQPSSSAKSILSIEVINDSIEIRSNNQSKGKGLFTTRPRTPKDLLCSVDRPLLSALDTPRLKDTCYHCHKQAADQLTISSQEHAQANLKLCSRCSTVRFCGTTCQSIAWDRHHKYECPIYRTLSPRVLPSTVRAVMRLLLQRKNGRLPAHTWPEMMSLESHTHSLEQTGGSRWTDLVLMAQGTREYSRTSEDLSIVLGLFCRVVVNALTLMTPFNDPLGLAVHPLLARVNHSCAPNAFVRFSRSTTAAEPGVQLIPLHDITAGQELFISYVDTTDPTVRRQSLLSTQYFFHCTCARCTTEQDKERSDELFDLDETSSLSQLNAAMSRLSSTMHATAYPIPRLHHLLAQHHIEDKNYTLALHHMLITVVEIDPILYPPTHPTRSVHLVVLLRLLDVVGHERDSAWCMGYFLRVLEGLSERVPPAEMGRWVSTRKASLRGWAMEGYNGTEAEMRDMLARRESIDENRE